VLSSCVATARSVPTTCRHQTRRHSNTCHRLPSSFFGNPPAVPTTVSAELIQVRARGFIDPHASRAFTFKRFVEDLGLNINVVNRRSTGPIHELQTRSGGWHTVSRDDHRLQLRGVGEIPLVVNFARAGQPARWATVYFLVVEDGPLPRGSTIDFVLHYPLASAFKDWIRDASHCDIVTQASQQSALAMPRFVVPRAAPSEPASPASGTTERYHPVGRTLNLTRSAALFLLAAARMAGECDSADFLLRDRQIEWRVCSLNRSRDEDSWKTAFSTHFGQIEWRVYPEELVPSPEVKNLPEPVATQSSATQTSEVCGTFDSADFFSHNRSRDRNSCMSAPGEDSGSTFFTWGALRFKTGFTTHRLCVSYPEDRIAIITRLHYSVHSGHYGPVATAARVQAGYYWPEMWWQIRAYVYSCRTCQLRRAVLRVPLGPGGRRESAYYQKALRLRFGERQTVRDGQICSSVPSLHCFCKGMAHDGV